MIGDFDSSSNALWTLYKNEAKNIDGTQIHSLKEDMDSALVFVCSCPICTYEELNHTDAWPHRPVYFLLSSLHSYSIANKT